MERFCECGCGSPVRRRFRQGHDGRLKGRLIRRSRDSRWWVREPAVTEMITRGWGHFLPMETIANTPIRSRHHGRFVETRHIHNLVGAVQDEGGATHSHWSCPEIEGRGQWVAFDDSTGWPCAVCIHTHDWSEIVGHRRMMEAA